MEIKYSFRIFQVKVTRARKVHYKTNVLCEFLEV